jgi:hypothetical protein
MLRKLLPIILINLILALLFVYSNYSIWNAVNSVPTLNGASPVSITTSDWKPFEVVWHHYAYYNGNLAMSGAIFFTYNFPYWLFFISTALNLYFIARFTKNKSLQQ